MVNKISLFFVCLGLSSLVIPLASVLAVDNGDVRDDGAVRELRGR